MIQIHEVRATVAAKLAANVSLVAMLAANPPWANPEGTKAKANSIVPMSEIARMNPMYIGIQAGPATRQEMNAFDTFMYIRAYNNADKTHVDIDKAISLIASSLHRQRLTAANTAFCEVLLEEVRPDAIDDALNQRYREAQFKLVIL